MRNSGVSFIRVNILIICALCLFSCSGPKAPEFIGLKDTMLEFGSGNDIEIRTNVDYRNPNPYGATLVEYDIAISLENIPITRIQERPDITIPANEEFSIPVNANIKLDELKKYESRITKILEKAIFSSLMVHYEGSVTFSLSGMRLKIPVDQTDDVKLNLNLQKETD